MTRVYVVPGLLSCELYEDADRVNLLWVSYTRLVQNEIGRMRLAPNGVDPGPPDGTPLFVGDPLPDYYDTPLALLLAQLRPHGYKVAVYTYDWRMDPIRAGEGLAAAIVANETSSDPCSIAAHSMGGIVARSCWRSLLQRGSEALVRRIVTLGTPHQGSYASVEVASGYKDTLRQLAYLSNAIGGNANLIVGLAPYFPWSTSDLRALALTWPSIYALMPVLGGTDAAVDPNRDKLYVKANWPNAIPVSQAHLDYARDVVGPFLRDRTLLPPPHVLTTVSGGGNPTATGLTFPDQLGQASALGTTEDGDGEVTVASALIPDSAVYQLNAAHHDLPLVATKSGQLAEWILAIRGPSDPVPPPVFDPSYNPPAISTPPIPAALGGSFGYGPCDTGVCKC